MVLALIGSGLEYHATSRRIHGREVSFVVEQTRAGHIHACSVDDIAKLLAHVPEECLHRLELFVLHQPKRKEAILQSVWGRLAYFATVGRPQDGGVFSGPAVFLAATPVDFSFWFGASAGPMDQAELERLREDGHELLRRGSRYRVKTNPDSVRSTQLYRTLLHEIGHWVDWLTKVELASAEPSMASDELSDAYFRRPSRERESFAHQYADALGARLRESGVIPFGRLGAELA